MGFFCTVGIAAVAVIAYVIAKFVYLHFGVKTNLSQYGAKKGAWALVTGARDGIGKGFAVALADKGFNVILVARNADGLTKVAQEIEAKSKVQTQVVAVDAGASDAVSTVVSAIAGKELRVLVNNVGVNTQFPTLLAETADAEVANMINVNVAFTTNLTKALIPQLSAGGKTAKSLVYMLSSFTGIVPVPMMAVYSATKAYNDVLARALAGELKPAGIDVKSVVPHYVVSAMSGFSRPSWSVPDAVTFAKATLAKTAIWDYAIAPHWFHDVTARIAGLLPDPVVGSKGLQTMKAVRAKLQRRAEKNK
jgi:17beta-estradiol 17-dehydrogenase / very-long-chain 3-oxoacyl-CoA reductase